MAAALSWTPTFVGVTIEGAYPLRFLFISKKLFPQDRTAVFLSSAN
jgi:hypothetical protein